MKLNCSNCINEWELFGITGLCPGCDNGSRFHPVKRKRAPKKPITNADRIRAMTDEKLAVVIAWPYIAAPPWCAEHTTCPYTSEDPAPCDKCALDWLKKQAEEVTI